MTDSVCPKPLALPPLKDTAGKEENPTELLDTEYSECLEKVYWPFFKY